VGSDGTTTCAGCEKVSRDLRVLFELAPGVNVRLCPGRYRDVPKKSCLISALQKAERCPGCGKGGKDDPDHRTELGKLCSTCRGIVDRAQSLDATAAGELLMHVFDRYALNAPAHNRTIEELHEAFTQHLARACAGVQARHAESTTRWRINGEAGGRFGGYTPDRESRRMRADDVYGPAVDLLPAQAEAVQQLFTTIQQLTDAAHALGRAEGSNLLVQLARGEVSPQKFDGTVKSWSKDEEEPNHG
jgi:hypothetical protein